MPRPPWSFPLPGVRGYRGQGIPGARDTRGTEKWQSPGHTPALGSPTYGGGTRVGFRGGVSTPSQARTSVSTHPPTPESDGCRVEGVLGDGAEDGVSLAGDEGGQQHVHLPRAQGVHRGGCRDASGGRSEMGWGWSAACEPVQGVHGVGWGVGVGSGLRRGEERGGDLGMIRAGRRHGAQHSGRRRSPRGRDNSRQTPPPLPSNRPCPLPALRCHPADPTIHHQKRGATLLIGVDPADPLTTIAGTPPSSPPAPRRRIPPSPPPSDAVLALSLKALLALDRHPARPLTTGPSPSPRTAPPPSGRSRWPRGTA